MPVFLERNFVSRLRFKLTNEKLKILIFKADKSDVLRRLIRYYQSNFSAIQMITTGILQGISILSLNKRLQF